MTTVPRTILKDWVILVVDDEEDSLEVAERLLKFYGAKVYTAPDGEEGLALALKIKPIFILSDLSMPVLDGWGLLKRLKLDRTTMDIPIFALTAHAIVGDRERAIAAGFYNYLTKPLTPATFIHDLLNLLESVPELAEALIESRKG